MVVRHILTGVVVLLLGLPLAQDNGDFLVAYEDSSSEVHLEYAKWLRQQSFLENLVVGLNATVALPYDIGVVAGQCDEVNAFWSPDYKAIIICYELFEYLSDVFRTSVSSQDELDSEVLGAVEFIFYHELGHALIDTFSIPFTGREEDAVDQFSSIILLSQGRATAALSGASFFLVSGQATVQSGISLSEMAFWDEHSLDQQRFYDIVCLVYGSDPSTYDFLLKREAKGFLLSDPTGYLPKERADRCTDEYKDISNSWGILINAYVPAVGGSEAPAIEAQAEPVIDVADVVTTNNYDQSFNDMLASGDNTLEGGQYVHSYEIQLTQGQELAVELSSTAFDTYLIVSSPDGYGYVNDDATLKVAGYLSRLMIPVTATGTWLIGVSSYAAGETGSYELGISTTDNVYEQVFSETLAEGDRVYETGELFDSYEYTFQAGQVAKVVLSANDFDSYLIIRTPSGEYWYNDDFENHFGLARLDFDVIESGTYTIEVSSYSSGESGAYHLAVSTGGTVGQAEGELLKIIEDGQLSKSDAKFESGEFYDVYSYEFTLGQNLIMDVISSEFNTYIMAVSPSGQKYYNDDYYADDPSKTDAGLDIYVEEAGTWYIYASSAKVGEVGNYSLLISDIGNQGSTTEAPPVDVKDMTSTKGRSSNMGQLALGDDTLDDGSYVDYYSVDLEAGQEATFSVVSADFETYLGVLKPSGEVIEFEGEDKSRSKITFRVEESGTYFIFVTSTTSGQEGNYLLSIKK